MIWILFIVEQNIPLIKERSLWFASELSSVVKRTQSMITFIIKTKSNNMEHSIKKEY